MALHWVLTKSAIMTFEYCFSAFVKTFSKSVKHCTSRLSYSWYCSSSVVALPLPTLVRFLGAMLLYWK